MDALLCSINERLGGGAGQDFDPLGKTWLLELVEWHKDDEQGS